ncbi:MAG: hypothetical protein ACREIA_00505 [Opitutaceae bacterium]
MAKVEIELVAEVLKDNDLDQEMVDRIVRQITKVAEKAADEAAADREPPARKQWVVIVSDPRGELPEMDMVGWVVQIPENVSPATATERIIKGAHHYNTTRRGRKHPAKSIAEACEVVGAKFFKDEHVTIKTKLPVTALKTDNILPGDQSSKITLDELRRG